MIKRASRGVTPSSTRTGVSDSVVHHIAASEGSDLAVLHKETREASGVRGMVKPGAIATLNWHYSARLPSVSMTCSTQIYLVKGVAAALGGARDGAPGCCIRGPSKLESSRVRARRADREPHTVGLVGIDAPVVGVGVEVGDALAQLEAADRVEVLLAFQFHNWKPTITLWHDWPLESW